MKLLAPRAHGLCDLVLVAALVAAPGWLGFGPVAALASLTLAGLWLTLTLLTAAPLGIVRRVPLALHGAMELALSLALVVLPWLAGFARHRTSRNFFVVSGVLLFAVWLLTDYAGAPHEGSPDEDTPHHVPTSAPRH